MTWTRMTLLAALPVAAVAVIAGVVSYSHIEALGLMTGQTLADARLLPLAVDGLIVAGSVILLAGSLLGWIGVSLGVAGTLYANVASGLPRGPLAAAVAAWPAVAFTVASFMLERWLKAQAAGSITTETAPDITPDITAETAGASPEVSPPVSAAVSAPVSDDPDIRAAHRAYRQSVRAGKPLSQRKLGEMYGKSQTWGASRIREAEAGPHPVAAAR